MKRAQLKICGITNAEDFAVCRDFCVDVVGINLWPGSKRAVTIGAARRWLPVGGASPQRIGVLVDPDPKNVGDIVRELALDAVQPHGDRDVRDYAALGVPYVWVIRGTPTLAALSVPAPDPLWVLLDASVPGFGGAGQTTDWDWAARATRHLAPLPVWLAGGITPENADAALARVEPAGLDVASGAECEGAVAGKKDAARIERLIRICHGAPQFW